MTTDYYQMTGMTVEPISGMEWDGLEQHDGLPETCSWRI